MAQLKDPLPLVDEQAEAFALGCMMRTQEAAKIGARLLREEDFFMEIHRIVFQAICATDGQPDPFTVSERLRALDKLNYVGGEDFVAQLSNDVPSEMSMQRYAYIVADRAERRRVVRALGDIAKAAHKLDDDLPSLYNTAMQSFAGAAMARFNAHQDITEIAQSTAQIFEDRVNSDGKLLGLSTGIRDLDKITGGWQATRLIVIGGRPGAGKSVLMAQSSLRAAQAGAYVKHYSLEMSSEEVLLRMAKNLAKVGYSTGEEYKLTPSQQTAMICAMDEISKLRLSIRNTHSVQQIITECEIEHRRGQLDLVVIDQLQNATPDVGTRDAGTRDAEIGAATRALKQLALSLKVPVILGSALNRQAEGVRPTLATLRESGSIESDADVALLLWQEDAQTQPNIVTASLIKNRDNPAGDVSLYFEKSMHRFGDAVKHPY